MKFGKSLSTQIEETLPEWRDKFLSYKDLKKKLKLIDGGGERASKRRRVEENGGVGDGEGSSGAGMTEEENDFITLLEEEIEKFNGFFVDKEEEYVIRLKELQDRKGRANLAREVYRLKKEIVDFHGEMVLLENYSALNYTGLVKILKKYEKRTGSLIRLPYIQKVLQEPFYNYDVLNKLVKECELMLDHLFLTKLPSSYPTEAFDGAEVLDEQSSVTRKDDLLTGPKELAEIEYIESLYMKSTLSALRTLKEVRKGSSTVSVFSLPPLQSSGVEETWNKIPVLEQVAK
ncbi:hypothetical protein Scep_008401 [Stephania cephalantha]|uniref:SPX domain-containing protein n=1 Tax=Stephania cephalantha TaxID=152367 RepID=A0AAP0KDK6_9MAGN